jgi:hypothetical protein
MRLEPDWPKAIFTCPTAPSVNRAFGQNMRSVRVSWGFTSKSVSSGVIHAHTKFRRQARNYRRPNGRRSPDGVSRDTY